MTLLGYLAEVNSPFRKPTNMVKRHDFKEMVTLYFQVTQFQQHLSTNAIILYHHVSQRKGRKRQRALTN